jgi:hypothetical protein
MRGLSGGATALAIAPEPAELFDVAGYVRRPAQRTGQCMHGTVFAIFVAILAGRRPQTRWTEWAPEQGSRILWPFTRELGRTGHPLLGCPPESQPFFACALIPSDPLGEGPRWRRHHDHRTCEPREPGRACVDGHLSEWEERTLSSLMVRREGRLIGPTESGGASASSRAQRSDHDGAIKPKTGGSTLRDQ